MSRFRGEYITDRKALHNAVREEAGNRCVRCGHPQGDSMYVTDDVNRVIEDETGNKGSGGKRVIVREMEDVDWNGDVLKWRVFRLMLCTEHCTHGGDPKLRILTVHHLDGHKANNAWWNLLALCQVCHLQIQGKVIPEQPYLWPHSPWFVPYVCGFYAAYFGKEEITRAQADAEPEKYLRMGQPWLYAAGDGPDA